MKRQLKLFSLLAVIIVGMFAVVGGLLFSAAKATYVEGRITQNTTWTLTDSPFVVSKSVIVDPAVTLIIEPGVEVRFGGNFSLIVEGTLLANGTQSRPITFTSNKISPRPGDWITIRFSATTQSTLANCIVKYASNGTTVQNGKLTIKNSELSENSQNGITIVNGQVNVEKSEISYNLEAGVCVTGNNQVTIQDSTLRANADGILLTGNSTSGVDIRQNLFLLNTQSGIQLDADAYINLVILKNTLSSNNYGFYISGGADTYITNNSISYNGIGIFYENGEDHEAHFNDIYGNNYGMDIDSDAIVNASNNYWGDETGPYHVSMNPNGKGNPVGGNGFNLDFIFFLTAPIGYINQRPTGNLLSDLKVVRPNRPVVFFATTSSDDGHVDQYYFNFGDGQNSGWTTLSVYNHNYSSVGTYYPTVTVMDDFGVKSNNTATVRIDVRDLPSLGVTLTPSDIKVSSGGQLPITVYASDGASPVANANITLFLIVGGFLTPSSGLTNSTGYFTSSFTAPFISEKIYVRITATAAKSGYADGSDYEYVSVLPLLSVNVALDYNEMKSDSSTSGTVHVTHDGNPVVGVSVRISSDSGGTFSVETGSTDINGDFNFTFSAPQTLIQFDVTVTATATKSGYWDGVAQTKLTVDPRTLTVQFTGNPGTLESNRVSTMIAHVTSDGAPVMNATVSLTSDLGGIFSVTSGNTDVNGDLRFIFTAPEVTTEGNVTITASVTKNGYVAGEGQAEITVSPVPSAEPTSFLGLPLTTLLLIAIPIAVVAIVIVLIKAKVIVISREQEQ